MFPSLRKTLSSHHWQWTSFRNFFADSSACVGPLRTLTTTRTKCSNATASSTSMPLLQRAAALQQTARITFSSAFVSHQDRHTAKCKVLPGHSGDHHASSQLFVVLGAYDVTAVVTQGDVGRLGVQRACVCGRHRDDAQVTDVPEGSVQVVHCRPEWIQVTERFKTSSDWFNSKYLFLLYFILKIKKKIMVNLLTVLQTAF